jgi:hypothetical protein
LVLLVQKSMHDYVLDDRCSVLIKKPTYCSYPGAAIVLLTRVFPLPKHIIRRIWTVKVN